jgi:hypothetical protein
MGDWRSNSTSGKECRLKVLALEGGPVIQSTGDKYVPATEARKLFRPDTPTRHLYSVEASNHGFSGGRDEMLKDLDDALAWITSMLSLKEKAKP